jgi:hypothetical protein
MPISKQTPLTSPRGGDPHIFLQRPQDWDAAVFDQAILFRTVRMRSVPPRQLDDFETIAEAVTYAQSPVGTSEGACVYAVCSSGRFTLLDREKWQEWVQRTEETLP